MDVVRRKEGGRECGKLQLQLPAVAHERNKWATKKRKGGRQGGREDRKGNKPHPKWNRRGRKPRRPWPWQAASCPCRGDRTEGRPWGSWRLQRRKEGREGGRKRRRKW